MIGVQQHADVGAVHAGDIIKGLGGGVYNAGFKAVYRLNTVGYAAVLRRFDYFLHASDGLIEIGLFIIHDFSGNAPARIAHAGKQCAARDVHFAHYILKIFYPAGAHALIKGGNIVARVQAEAVCKGYAGIVGKPAQGANVLIRHFQQRLSLEFQNVKADICRFFYVFCVIGIPVFLPEVHKNTQLIHITLLKNYLLNGVFIA